MNVGAVSAGFDIGKFLLNGLKFVEFGPIKKAASFAAKPVFMSMKQKSGESEDAFRARMLHKDKSGWQTFLDSFGWGDALTVGGIIGWIGTHILGSGKVPGVEGQPAQESGFLSWLRFGFKFLTFLGTPLAAIGRLKCFHFYEFLPKEVANRLEVAKMEGESQFIRDFDVEKNFSKYLRYDENIWQGIRGLHKGNQFGYIQRFVTGPPGTGKTEGVRMVCKKIKDAAKVKGQKVEIKEVNIPSVMRQIELEAQQKGMLSELAEMGGAHGAASVFKVDPIRMMEIVLATVENEINHGKKNGVRVIFVLDEVDKALQMDRINELASQDKLDFAKLKEILGQLQRFLDDNFGDVIMISNEDIEYFNQLPVKAEAAEARAGFLSRIRTKRLEIGIPNPKTQGLIMATYLLGIPGDKKLEEVFEEKIIAGIKENIPVVLERKGLPVDTEIDINSKDPKIQIIVEEALGQFMHDTFTCQLHLYGRFTGRQFQEVVNVSLKNDYTIRCEEHEAGTRVKKPYITLSGIDTFLRTMLANFEKEDRENIIHRQDGFAETIIRGYFTKEAIYRKLLENIEKAQSPRAAKPEDKKPFSSQLAERFSGVYRCVKADGSYLFVPINITDSVEVDGERYSYYHRVRLENPTKKDQDLSDPNNWIVETFYYKLRPGVDTADIDSHIKAMSNEAVYTTPQTGGNFLEAFKKLFSDIHRSALLGKLGPLKGVAKAFQRLLEQKGLKIDDEGLMGLLGGFA